MLALAGLVLAGCAGTLADPNAGGPAGPQPIALSPGGAPAYAAPVPGGDPIAAFAATAAPGTEGQVVLPGGARSTRVRLLRAYSAASGRECREVLVGAGAEERTSLVCRGEAGWAMARPLLQSGSGRAP